MDNIMIRVGGSDVSFRCECGANVFHKANVKLVKSPVNRTIFECNGCGAWYSEDTALQAPVVRDLVLQTT